ncbi:MAG: FAD:protein FMN transferase [Nitrospirota bacterium]
MNHCNSDRHVRLRVAFILLSCIFLLLSLNCSVQEKRLFKKDGIVMNTFVSITVVSDSRNEAEASIDAAFAEIKKIEKLLNFFSADSEVSLINKNAGLSAVNVSPDTLKILKKALQVSQQTHGAFDITVGPVLSLYDFRRKIKPEEKMIEKALYLVNYSGVVVNEDESEVFLRKKNMLVNLGGIAKGYAADKAVAALKERRIESGLVAIAGDIRAFGVKPDGNPWKVGIRNPRGEGKEDDIMAVIHLRDMSVSTSGDYERFFMDNGKRYHHLISPKTGHPASECISVSIIASEAALTDSFATGVFILGPEKGLHVLRKLGFDGLIVDAEGKIHMTPGLKRMIELKREAKLHLVTYNQDLEKK